MKFAGRAPAPRWQMWVWTENEIFIPSHSGIFINLWFFTRGAQHSPAAGAQTLSCSAVAESVIPHEECKWDAHLHPVWYETVGG